MWLIRYFFSNSARILYKWLIIEFAENNQFPVDVVALEPCEVIIVSKESIMKQFAQNETFLRGFMTFNANRTHFPVRANKTTIN